MSQRRTIVPAVRDQLPSKFRSGDDELFILFLEEYYKWLEESGEVHALLGSIHEINDIDTIITEFFEEFRLEYLPCIPASALTDRATLVKQIRQLYRAKGSVKSIEALFRILYDQEIQVLTDIPETTQANVRVESTDPDFIDSMTNRVIQGTFMTLTVDTGSGTYTVGETVTQVNSSGTSTGEVYSWNGSDTLQVTKIDAPFEVGYSIIGSSSGASYNVSAALDQGFIGFAEEIVFIDGSSPATYDIYITNITYQDDPGNIFIDEHIITADNDANIIEVRTLGVIDTATLTNAGTGYAADVVVPFGTPGDGIDGEVTISDVYENILALPGTWSFNTTSTDTLDYTPFDDETLNQYLFAGNTLEVDGTDFTILLVSSTQNTVKLDSPLAQTEDLTKVFKSFNDDDRRILSLAVSDPGYGYTTAPTLDFSGIGDGNATGIVSIDGSYSRIAEIDKGTAFGYIIRSGIPLSQYIKVLKKTVHPAGLRVTGEVISVTIDPNDISLELYNLYSPSRINYDDPATANSRLFFEYCIKMFYDYHGTLGQYYQDTVIDDLPGTIEDANDRDLIVSAIDIIYDITGAEFDLTDTPPGSPSFDLTEEV